MIEDNIVKKIKRWKPVSKRPTGRPKMRWEDDVFEDVRSMNVRSWKNVAQNREIWRRCLSEPEPYTDCSALEEEEEYFRYCGLNFDVGRTYVCMYVCM
jgi:hypothetical protein